jgi:hypothetical protein
VALLEEKISMADSACRDLDQDFVALWLLDWNFLDGPWGAWLLDYDCAAGFWDRGSHCIRVCFLTSEYVLCQVIKGIGCEGGGGFEFFVYYKQ